jgi:hypothetical protein
VHAPLVRRAVAGGHWIGVDGKVAAGDQAVVGSGELLRGNENVRVVGMFGEDP